MVDRPDPLLVELVVGAVRLHVREPGVELVEQGGAPCRNRHVTLVREVGHGEGGEFHVRQMKRPDEGSTHRRGGDRRVHLAAFDLPQRFFEGGYEEDFGAEAFLANVFVGKALVNGPQLQGLEVVDAPGGLEGVPVDHAGAHGQIGHRKVDEGGALGGEGHVGDRVHIAGPKVFQDLVPRLRDKGHVKALVPGDRLRQFRAESARFPRLVHEGQRRSARFVGDADRLRGRPAGKDPGREGKDRQPKSTQPQAHTLAPAP